MIMRAKTHNSKGNGTGPVLAGGCFAAMDCANTCVLLLRAYSGEEPVKSGLEAAYGDYLAQYGQKAAQKPQGQEQAGEVRDEVLSQPQGSA